MTDGAEWRAEAKFISEAGRVIDRVSVVFCAEGYSKYSRSEIERDGQAKLFFDTTETVDSKRYRRMSSAKWLQIADGHDSIKIEVSTVDGREEHGFYFEVSGAVVEGLKTEGRFEDMMVAR